MAARSGDRHEYAFDASRVRIGGLLEAAGARGEVRDVETHRAPIDAVIADIYQAWQGGQPESISPNVTSRF